MGTFRDYSSERHLRTTKAWRNLALKIFKYAPVLTSAIMTIHVAILLCGVTLGFAEVFCAVSILPLIIAYCFSKGLHFCWIHRSFIGFTAGTSLCIEWQQWIGFGIMLTPFRWLMLLIGLGLFYYLFTHLDEYINDNGLLHE